VLKSAGTGSRTLVQIAVPSARVLQCDATLCAALRDRKAYREMDGFLWSRWRSNVTVMSNVHHKQDATSIRCIEPQVYIALKLNVITKRDVCFALL
jgi:hypothetical protein